MPDNPDKIKISLDDLADVKVPPRPMHQQPSGSGHHAPPPSSSAGKGSVLYKSWFYLGLAGFISALLGWAIMEPSFHEVLSEEWIEWMEDRYTEEEFVEILERGGTLKQPFGNTYLFLGILGLICVAFPLSECITERTFSKIWVSGSIALGIGLLLSFPADIIANKIYGSLQGEDPVAFQQMLARALGWMTAGIVPGIVYGILSKSTKKCLYGVIGGCVGGFLGGFFFDPISQMVGGAEPSRALGFAFLGTTAGIAIGLVESALKDRWLYVQSGPLAGKQFILYKDRTVLGQSPQADIFLFKSKGVQPEHAVINTTSSGAVLETRGPVNISGQPRNIGSHPLRNGDLITIDCYTFRFEEKSKS